MIFNFDYNGLYTQPDMILCNPTLDEFECIMITKGLKITPRFNAISELTFSIYEKYEGKVLPVYELIKKNKVIHVIGFGYFVVTLVQENMDGGANTKDVTAYSYEFTLNKKYANLDDDTYKFYDPIDTSKTLLGQVIALNPSWTIGHVDVDLWTAWRTFSDVDGNKTIYNFLMTDIEEAYGCIFKFDTENMTINAYTPNNSITETDIVLNFDSTIKNIEIAEDSSSIKTALHVAGAGDLTISNVNPLGDSYIYDFSYYKTLEWMDQDLIDALTAWEELVDSYQTEYSEKLAILKDLNAALIVLQGELTTLQSALQDIEKARTEEYPHVTTATSAAYNAKQAEIKAKQAEIDAKNNEITNVTSELTVINDAVSFSNNFTELQLSQLDRLIDEDSFTKDSFQITDSMNNVEVIELTQQLYDAGKEQLAIVSHPCYTFAMDTVNFLFIKEFLPYIQQIKMGCKIYVQTDKDWFSPLLLEMTLDYDNPENFSMTFGNRFRIKDNVWSVTELMGTVQSTTSSVKGNSSLWTKGAKTANLFTEYQKSTLNAATQAIINSEKQSITIDQAGIRSRKLLEDGSYSPRQWWGNDGMIVMTNDNWQTAKLAIGEINGIYCVNAEVIAGNLLAGEELKIYTSDGSFTVDESGTKLVNSMLTLQSKETSGRIKNQILLNPDDGFKIQANTTVGTGSPVYKDIFALASDGSGIVMEGSVTTKGQLEYLGQTYNTKAEFDSGRLMFSTNDTEVGAIYAFSGGNVGLTITGLNNNKVYIDNGGQISTDTLFVKNIYGLGSQSIDKAYIDEFHSNMIYTEDIHTDEIQTGHLSFDYGGYANRIESIDVVTNVTYSSSTNSISVTKKSIKCLA